MVERANPERFKQFLEEAQAAAERRYSGYQQLAQIKLPYAKDNGDKSPPGNGDGEPK
jgi:hypothetical protein